MATRKPHLVPTNIKAEDLLMDIRGGGRDSRYYCLPPMHFKTPVSGGGGRGYPFHLVTQGHEVGVFDNWLEAKASLSGYPDSSNHGYDSIEECIDAWQGLCRLGIHPHAVDPAPPSSPKTASSTTPSSASPSSTTTTTASTSTASLSRQQRPATGGSTRRANTQSPPPSPRKRGRSTPSAKLEVSGEFVNFAIRGEGIVSSSAERTEDRYRELQRRGEEPDLLITRSFREATFFAVDEEEEG